LKSGGPKENCDSSYTNKEQKQALHSREKEKTAFTEPEEKRVGTKGGHIGDLIATAMQRRKEPVFDSKRWKSSLAKAATGAASKERISRVNLAGAGRHYKLLGSSPASKRKTPLPCR